MDRNRLLYRAYIEVPYTIDEEKVEKQNLDTEDGLIKLFLNGPEVTSITPSGCSFGIDRYWLVRKLDEFPDLSRQEKSSILKYFDDNNLSIDDDYIIIDYDELHQCSTILDANNVLIFEGDYVKVPDDYEEFGQQAGMIYEVFFNAGAFRLKPKRWVYDPQLKRKPRGFYLEEDYVFTIVGNVVEGIKDESKKG